MYIGLMVKFIFAKITDAKRFLCFLMLKNAPAERKSPWDNHKSFRSKICSGGGGGGGGSELSLSSAVSLFLLPFLFLPIDASFNLN